MRSKHDVIQITAAPPAWRLKATMQKLVDGLRSLKLLHKETLLVVSISCVGDREMTDLNLQYRHKKGCTDVLSFEQRVQPPGRGIRFLGDIVLCIPVVQSQAKEQGHGVRTEATVLLAHALLHLLGYDHDQSTAMARKMGLLEQKLLAKTPGLVRRSRVKS